MATKYSKFTITSIPDPNSGGMFIPDYERDMKAIVNQAVKSALSEGGYFKTSSRVVDKRTGETKLDVYVHSDDTSVVLDSLKTELGKLTYKDNFGRPTQDPKYAVSTTGISAKESRRLERDEAGDSEVSRFNRGALLKVIGALTLIADITRRILSSVLTFSQKTVKDMITASNLGMSYESVRSYRHIETAHGMKEGTITGAVSDIQNKFGNITSLDENALKALAVVMGGKIEEMATMGLGASNPEKILGAILDDFNAKANAGYNSVGQYVGEQQARRELYSYLLKVSPQVADIFATMQEEQHNINSLYKNQADTFENWKSAFPTARGGGNTWAGYGTVSLTGQQWQKVQEMINQIKEGITVSLASDVFELLQRIANSRFFMTETEKRQLNEKNRRLNENELNTIDKTISRFKGQYDNLSEGEKAYYEVLQEQKEALEAELKKEEINDITAPEAILQSRAERKIREASKKPLSEGMKITPIADITPEELEDVVRIYNLDTPEMRAQYAKARGKQVEKADREVEKLEERQRSNLYFEFDESLNASKKNFREARKNGQLKKVYKSIGSSTKGALETLYELGEIFGFQYDLDNEEGSNYEEKIYSALKRAEEEKLGALSRGKFAISTQAYIDRNFKPIPRVDKELQVEYDNAYLAWLYTHNPYKMEEINEHIRGYRGDQIVEDMQTNNRIQAVEWLYRTEGTSNDWRKTLSGLPNGTYVITGSNTSPEYGENVYKIIVEQRDNGRVVSSKEILNTEGGWSFAGDILTVDVRNGKMNVSDLGTPTSVQAGKQ